MDFKLLRRFFSYLLLLTVVSAVALAQRPAQPGAPGVDQLREHISYLAADKLEGRRTGSVGANLAAEYIAREFSRYGLRRSIGVDLPGMSILEADSPHRYLQEFPYVAGVELGKGNLLSVRLNAKEAPIDLRVYEDWMPLGFSSNSHIISGQAVFAGYGIIAADLKRDDYTGLLVKDKIVVVLDRTPDGDNPHGQFARFEDPRWKALIAKDKGAKALVLLSQEEKFSDERLARLHYDNGGEAGLPVVVVAKPAALSLLRALARSVYDTGGPSNCGADVKMADGTVVTPCSKLKLIKKPDGSREAELPDGTRVPIGPDGKYSVDKFYGPKELERFSWTATTAIVRHEVDAANVVGILDGSDPQLKKEAIVIGAHYDHLGRGGEGSLAPREGEIHHGADDNASGVAGLLELARIFSSQQPRPRRTIIFIAFSGEEEGLLGSNYYVNHPILPLANVAAMINMDMIGRMKENKLIVGGVGTAQEWPQTLASANASERMKVSATGADGTATEPPFRSVPIVVGANGRTIVSIDYAKPFELTLNQDGYGPSDHSSFYAKQIPVLFFWTGTHDDYHKPSDTADKINYTDEARVVALVARIVSDIDKSDKRPAYTVARSESTGRSTGFRVYLGTIPNYADANDGLLLDGVRDDSPASKAGLKAGDKIVKLGGRDVRNVYDYTYALGEMRAGQEYEIEVMRGGERLKLKITPAARK